MTAGLADVTKGVTLDRFFAALASGDIAAARACCTAASIFWHNFDQREIDLDEAAAGWAGLGVHMTDIAFPVSARYDVGDGLVQRHAMEATLTTGSRIGWPICIFVSLHDGRIARLDEYIDRAGSYAVAKT